MEEYESLSQKIREILGGEPGNLKILEQQIDMDLQVEYYDCSRKIRDEVDEQWAFDHAPYLKEPGYSPDVKKDILARLASIEDVRCYRLIEDCLEDADEEIRDWVILALNESRMLLESKILDENQVFISTGLGGKGGKLRYFVVLVSRSGSDLSKTQQMVIGNEFDSTLKKYDALIEETQFSEFMASMLILLPMDYALKEVFREAISECNRYGDFLKDDFIVTNVKKLSFEEVKNFLEKNRGRD